MDFPQHVIERFWRKVDKSAGPDGCWLWNGCLRTGYGLFRYRHDKSMASAHRFSLMLSVGMPTAEKHQALHSCDNKRCCNPKHLRWGNDSDNMRDRYERDIKYRTYNAKRMAKVARSMRDVLAERQRKLKPSQVEYAARLRDAGYTFAQLSGWYCISETAISAAIRKHRLPCPPLQTTNEER